MPAPDKMPLTEHLTELRKRLLVSIIAIFIGFGICFYYSEYIFHILTVPLKKTLTFSITSPFIFFEDSKNPNINLVFLAPAEAFWMHMKISAISGLILTSPVILYEFWRFAGPGLLLKEKKYAIPLMAIMTSLFLIGALFCFLLVLPFAMNFLLTYKTETLKPMLSVGNYMDFCLKFILAFGAVFELPVVIVFLTKIGVVTADTLAKNRKYAVILAFILAALLTPTPDAFNQILMAGPIILLYEAGIWASRIFNRKKSESTSITKKGND
ncbi:MAG: twin-arginine translocase subunit TatC [Nitrospirae bacterium]|nr:twin-arginine translocase subunit TatC [Nitrospirota bacterium]